MIGEEQTVPVVGGPGDGRRIPGRDDRVDLPLATLSPACHFNAGLIGQHVEYHLHWAFWSLGGYRFRVPVYLRSGGELSTREVLSALLCHRN